MSDSDDSFENIDEPMVTDDVVDHGDQQDGEANGEGAEKRRLEEEVAVLKAQIEARDKLLDEKDREIERLKSSDRKRQLQSDDDFASDEGTTAAATSSTALARATASLRIRSQSTSTEEHKKQKLEPLVLDALMPQLGHILDQLMSDDHELVPHMSIINKSWHADVSTDLRQHMIGKLLTAIIPFPDPAPMHEQRVKDLRQYARKVEKDMFENADDKEEYYHLLAEKIFRIQQELRERKQKRLSETRESGVEKMGNTVNNEILATSSNSMGAVGASSGPPTTSQSGSTTVSALHPGSDRVFELAELRNWLEPILSEMEKCDDAVPFKMPVDPIALNIPDYFDIVKNPMDLSTIYDKLMAGQYSNPWQFCDDMWLIFDNAWLYNRKTSKVYGCTTRLSDLFIDLINPAMAAMRCSTGTKSSFNRVSKKKQEMDDNASSDLPTTSSQSAVRGDEMMGVGGEEREKEKSPEPTTSKSKRTPTQSDLDFDMDELRKWLEPVLCALNMSDDSIPFKMPVDPIALNIPDYFDVVKNPMDLSTIYDKLKSGRYSNPWQFCDDMWLMFDNAWLYNRKTSKVYKYATRLSKLFIELINPAMKEMGYCCGEKFTFTPPTLFCYGPAMCTIARDKLYYCYSTTSNKFGVEISEQITFCTECFDALPEEGISLTEDHTDSNSTVPKSAFKRRKNNKIEEEKFVNCTDCCRKFHQICALYNEKVFPDAFVCLSCRVEKKLPKPENKFLAKALPQCNLSTHLENRVNGVIEGRIDGNSYDKVTIRVLSSVQKEVEVKQMMKSEFCAKAKNAFPVYEKFPYTSKAIFAFQEIDGAEVCFFGMHVQEYGSDCAAPNARRVYIEALDSVLHYFEPRGMRSEVYHEILLGYLDYVGKLGYNTAHIWAAPPLEGEQDSIFNGHPAEQMIPTPERLQEWYRKMLDKGVEENCVVEYKDIYKQAFDDGLSSPADLPYFEGDFWPIIIEDCIKEVKNNNGSATDEEVTQKLVAQLEKHKEVFFTVQLAGAGLPKIVDPDGLMLSDMMESRETFLIRARNEHWEFTSLRRAKHSTMCIVREVHKERDNERAMEYTCNGCDSRIDSSPWHCNTCEDFDLCDGCNARDHHAHPLEKIMTAFEKGAPHQHESIQRCIHSLVHASQCRDGNCRRMSCHKMKRVVAHAKVCKKRKTATCPVCRQLIALSCYHAKFCSKDGCQVPFCMNIRQQLKDRRMTLSRRADMMIRRRMAGVSAFNDDAAAAAVV